MRKSVPQSCISYQEIQQSTSHKHGNPDLSRRDKADHSYDPVIAGTRDGSGSFVNDRAITRACQAKFEPPSLESNPKKTVFVGRLQLSTTEGQLRQLFSRCGTIRHVRLVQNLITGASRGYAFLTFKHSSAVRAAMAMHGTVVDGRPILVELEVGRTLPGWKPRRLGGGFGGRKESGQMRFGGRACPHLPSSGGTASYEGYRSRKRDRSNPLSHDRSDRSYSNETKRHRKDRSRSRSRGRSPYSSRSKRSEHPAASRIDQRPSSPKRRHRRCQPSEYCKRRERGK